MQNEFTTTGQGAFSAWNRMVMQYLFQVMVSWWGRRAFSHVEIPSMRNSEVTIISRNGFMTGREGLFFPCRILECGIVILEALQSCRWEVQEPRRGKEAGENGVERFGERFCVLARLLTRLLDRFVAVVTYATRLVRRVICSHIKCPRKLLLGTIILAEYPKTFDNQPALCKVRTLTTFFFFFFYLCVSLMNLQFESLSKPELFWSFPELSFFAFSNLLFFASLHFSNLHLFV